MSLFSNKKRDIRLIDLKSANNYVEKYHRHNLPTQGYIFAIGLFENDIVIGVAICGRPVARLLDDGKTIEILRVCTRGARNANSQLYSYAKKLSIKKGFKRVITYTLYSESGASLRAISAQPTKVSNGNRQWTNRPNRRFQEVVSQPKIRWEL